MLTIGWLVGPFPAVLVMLFRPSWYCAGWEHWLFSIYVSDHHHQHDWNRRQSDPKNINMIVFFFTLYEHNNVCLQNSNCILHQYLHSLPSSWLGKEKIWKRVSANTNHQFLISLKTFYKDENKSKYKSSSSIIQTFKT